MFFFDEKYTRIKSALDKKPQLHDRVERTVSLLQQYQQVKYPNCHDYDFLSKLFFGRGSIFCGKSEYYVLSII